MHLIDAIGHGTYIETITSMSSMVSETSISVSHKTKHRLDKHGKFKETYDEIINNLLDIVEAKK
jgi:hypothetical protein